MHRQAFFRIERRQVVLCWMQDWNPRSLEPNLQQTECPLTSWLSYRDSSYTLNSIAHPYDQWAFSLLEPTAGWLLYLALAIHTFAVVLPAELMDKDLYKNCLPIVTFTLIILFDLQGINLLWGSLIKSRFVLIKRQSSKDSHQVGLMARSKFK